MSVLSKLAVEQFKDQGYWRRHGPLFDQDGFTRLCSIFEEHLEGRAMRYFSQSMKLNLDHPQIGTTGSGTVAAPTHTETRWKTKARFEGIGPRLMMHTDQRCASVPEPDSELESRILHFVS